MILLQFKSIFCQPIFINQSDDANFLHNFFTDSLCTLPHVGDKFFYAELYHSFLVRLIDYFFFSLFSNFSKFFQTLEVDSIPVKELEFSNQILFNDQQKQPFLLFLLTCWPLPTTGSKLIKRGQVCREMKTQTEIRRKNIYILSFTFAEPGISLFELPQCLSTFILPFSFLFYVMN